MTSIPHYTVLLLVLTLSACVFPTRLADKAPYSEDDFGPIEVGKTTGEEIFARFGEPSEKYAQGKWWVYHEKREMSQWIWFFCVQTGCGGGDLGGDERLYTLMINLSEEGVLQRATVVHEKEPCSEDGSVCFRDGQLELAWDDEAGSIDSLGSCSVIIYGQTSAMKLGSVWIHISGGDEPPIVVEYRRPPVVGSSNVRSHITGNEAPVGSLTDRSVLHVPLKPGQFKVRAVSPILGDIAKSIELMCSRGVVHFAKLLYEEPNASSFAIVGPSLGRDEIANRSVRLLRDP